MGQAVGQDRFLGSLFGMAIGDAMGMPVAGLAAGAFEPVTGFRPKQLADSLEIGAGEFTDDSEIALCIVESATVNDGRIDADNIAARMRMLARGESKRWMSPATLQALTESEESLQSSVPLADDAPATTDVATRGIPVGLLHAVGRLDASALWADAEAVTRITHGSPAAIASVAAVAFAVQAAARRPEDLAGTLIARAAEFLGGGALADVLAGVVAESRTLERDVAAALRDAVEEQSVEAAVLRAVNEGGAADSRAAIAGAVRGAADGIAAIPQRLIDATEGRIYVSLAAPWFFRAAQRRGGLVIELSKERRN